MFLKKFKNTIDGFTDGMYPSAFHKELKNITGNATITDGFTGGYCPSAFYQELQHIYWICHYYRRNKFVGIFRVGIFFCAQFPFVKPSVIFLLLTDFATECGITDERYADEHFSLVI
jgi:hypothetical protein